MSIHRKRKFIIQFKSLSIITSVIAFTLFSVLMVVPEVMFYLFQIPESGSAFFMSRRGAILFLGLAVLSWLVRDAVQSETKQAISLSVITMMVGLVVLGSIEYLRGYAGVGISLAVFTELTLGLAYFRIYSQGRHNV